ncbi:cytochrome c oxidase subunit 1 [Irineochytrium annulatum]|nr:cytochrome c oxidase subunit 1 [Irineochytrium annulatum]
MEGAGAGAERKSTASVAGSAAGSTSSLSRRETQKEKDRPVSTASEKKKRPTSAVPVSAGGAGSSSISASTSASPSRSSSVERLSVAVAKPGTNGADKTDIHRNSNPVTNPSSTLAVPKIVRSKSSSSSMPMAPTSPMTSPRPSPKRSLSIDRMLGRSKKALVGTTSPTNVDPPPTVEKADAGNQNGNQNELIKAAKSEKAASVKSLANSIALSMHSPAPTRKLQKSVSDVVSQSNASAVSSTGDKEDKVEVTSILELSEISNAPESAGSEVKEPITTQFVAIQPAGTQRLATQPVAIQPVAVHAAAVQPAGDQRAKRPPIVATSLKPGTSLRVLKSHQAGDDEELELEVGDIVELDVTPATEEEYWWKGTNRSWGPSNGKSGFFPSSNVELETWEVPAENPASQSANYAVALTSEPEDVEDGEFKDAVQEVKASDSVAIGTKVVCRDSYVREKADEVDLHKGDLVVVLEAPEGGWWRGMTNLGAKEPRSGWFPATNVESISDDSAGNGVAGGAGQKLVDGPISRPKSESSLASESARITPGTKVSCRESYAREKADELELHAGDVVVVLECPEGGWWRGMTNLGGKEPMSGWFPATAVEVIPDLASASSKPLSVDTASKVKTTSLPSSPLSLSPHPPYDDGSSTGSVSPTPPEHGNRKSWYKRLVPKKATSPGVNIAVDLKKGRTRSMSAPGTPNVAFKSSVNMLQNPNEEDEEESSAQPNTIVGPAPTPTPPPLHSEYSSYSLETVHEAPHLKSRNSLIQANPANRISKIVHKRASSAPSFPSPIMIAPSSSFAQEKSEWHDRLASDVYEAMGANEKKRMTTVWELIVTERDYVRDLKIIIDLFMRPMTELKFGTSKNVDALFSNVDELHIINSETCKNPITRNLDLGSFLIKPIQRICKYPLLIKEIIKYTDEDHRDYAVLLQALDTIQNILQVVNNGARSAESVRKIVEIQTNFVDKINLVAPSRYFIREETVHLMARDIRKPRRLFLFNDLIMLARKDWRDKYHLIEQSSLRNCRVSDVSEEGDQGSLFEIEILPAGATAASPMSPGPPMKRFLLSASSKHAKMGWLDAYKSVADAAVRRKHLSETSEIDFDLDFAASDEEEELPKRSEGSTVERIVQKELPKNEEPVPKKLEVNDVDQRQQHQQQQQSQPNLIKSVLGINSVRNVQEAAERMKEVREVVEKLKDAEAKLSHAEQQARETKEILLRAEESRKLVEKQRDKQHQKVLEMEKGQVAMQNHIDQLEIDLQQTSKDREHQAEKLAKVQAYVQDLKLEMEKQERRKSSLISEKEAEIEKAKREAKEAVERERAERKAEKAALAAERAAEKAQTSHEITALNTEMSRMKDEFDKRCRTAVEEGQSRLNIAKQETEAKLGRTEQEFEFRLSKAQEEARVKVQAMETLLQSTNMTHKSEIDHRDNSIRNLEMEKASEKQRLAGELEVFKQKALQAHENLKRSLADSQAHVKESALVLKEKDNQLRQREDVVKEKETAIGKLELERSALKNEIGRLETARNEQARAVSNLEQVVQERYQILSKRDIEIAELGHKLANQAERLIQTQKEAEKLRVEGRLSEENLVKTREELAKIKSEQSREQEQTASLDRNYRELTKQFEITRSQHASLTEANKRFASEHAKFKEMIAKHNHTLEKNQREIATHVTDLDRRKEEVFKLQAEVKKLKETLEEHESAAHKLLLRAERSESKLAEAERNHELSRKEHAEEKEQKAEQIAELKELMRKEAELAKAEVRELRERLRNEAEAKQEQLLAENGDLKKKLDMEVSDIKARKDQEERLLKNRLELVERLEKETQATKERYEKENHVLKEKMEFIEMEYREKSKAASLFKRRIKQLEFENETMSEKIRTLSDAFQEAEIRNVSVSAASKLVEEEASALRNRVQMSEREAAALEHRMAMYNELDKKYLELRDEAAKIAREAKGLETELKRSEAMDSKKSKEMAALKFTVDEVTKLINSVSTAFSTADNRSPTYLLPHQIEDVKLVSLLKKINTITSNFDKLQCEMEVERGKSKELEEVSAMLQQERVAASSTLKKLETRFRDKLKDTQAEFDALRSELGAIRKQLDEATSERDKAVLGFTEMRLKCETLEKSKVGVENQFMSVFERMQKMSESYVKDASRQGTESAELHKEIERLRGLSIEMQAELNSAKEKCRELESDRNYKQHLNESTNEAKKKLQELLNAANENGRAFALELQKSKTRIAELEDVEMLLKDVKGECMELSRKVDGQNDELQAKQRRINNLEEELRRKMEEVAERIRRSGNDAAMAVRLALDGKEGAFNELNQTVSKLELQLQAARAREETLLIKIQSMVKESTIIRNERMSLEELLSRSARESEILRTKLQSLQYGIHSSNWKLADVKLSETSLDAGFPNAPKRKMDVFGKSEMDSQRKRTFRFNDATNGDKIISMIITSAHSLQSGMNDQATQIMKNLTSCEEFLGMLGCSASADDDRTLRGSPVLSSSSPKSPPRKGKLPNPQSVLSSPTRVFSASMNDVNHGGDPRLPHRLNFTPHSTGVKSSQLLRARHDIAFSRDILRDIIETFADWTTSVEASYTEYTEGGTHRGEPGREQLYNVGDDDDEAMGGGGTMTPLFKVTGTSEIDLLDLSTLQCDLSSHLDDDEEFCDTNDDETFADRIPT